MPNEQRTFDSLQLNALGYYVYTLSDPRDGKVFYVGRGRGNRVFEHFMETDRLLSEVGLTRKAKHRRIEEIWAEGFDVKWVILRHGIDESTASHVEAAAIDALSISQNGIVLNEIAGMGGAEHGLLTEDDVLALGAQPVNPRTAYKSVFVFPVHNTLLEGRDLYTAARGNWSVSEIYRSLPNALAVAVANGISREVFRIDSWERINGAKYQFSGEKVHDCALLNRNWRAITGAAIGYWQYGNYLIVSFDGRGRFKFIRGRADRDTWLPCDVQHTPPS